MSISAIGSFLVGLILLIIVSKILTLPLKIIFRFVFNSIIGGILLAICASLGLIVKVYWWTIVLTGLFGVPGFVCAALITIII